LFKLLNRAYENALVRYDLFPVVELVFEDLKVLSAERHQELVLVYLPTVMDSPGTDRRPRAIAERAEQIAMDKQIRFWNLTSMFRTVPKSELTEYFLPDGHYSAEGNRLTATTLLQLLQAEFPQRSW
jgi:hypothetical protein